MVYNSNNKLLFNSILIGLMLSCNTMSILLKSIQNGIVFLIFIPFFLLCEKNIRLCANKKILREFVVYFFFFFVFILYSLIKGEFNETVIKYLAEFLILGVPFIVASHLPFLSKIVLKTIIFISIIVLPLYLSEINLEFLSYATDGEELMVISYNLIKMAIPAILMLYLDKHIMIIVLSLSIFIFSALFVVNIGARGAILSLFIAIILSFIYRRNKSIKLISKPILILILLIFVLIVYFYDIVNYCYDLLESNNIHSIALERIVVALDAESGSLSTGRDILFNKAINGFFDSPIWGNGIGSFDDYSGRYPHNIFLQQLYEGGLLFGFPMVLISIFSLKVMNSDINKSDRFLLIYLITTSVIHLIFSSYYWSSSIYWFLFGYSIYNINIKNNICRLNYKITS